MQGHINLGFYCVWFINQGSLQMIETQLQEAYARKCFCCLKDFEEGLSNRYVKVGDVRISR